MNDVVHGRPGEPGELAVLRGDQCNRVALLMTELGSRQVARAAEMRIAGCIDDAFDGFGE